MYLVPKLCQSRVGGSTEQDIQVAAWQTLVWNLAVSLDGKWAAGPAEVAELEVQAWNKLWQGDP
eukprot:5949621-Amphidinium_carterae.1